MKHNSPVIQALKATLNPNYQSERNRMNARRTSIEPMNKNSMRTEKSYIQSFTNIQHKSAIHIAPQQRPKSRDQSAGNQVIKNQLLYKKIQPQVIFEHGRCIERLSTEETVKSTINSDLNIRTGRILQKKTFNRGMYSRPQIVQILASGAVKKLLSEQTKRVHNS